VNEPNYDNYTVDELRSALASIDRQAYPERAEELEQRLIVADKLELDEINDIPHFTLARRRERFAAVLIDSLIGLFSSIPLWLYFGLERLKAPDATVILSAIVYNLVVYFVIHGYYMATQAQTVGKHFLHIRVEDLHGNQASFSCYYFRRYMPMAIAYSIPVAGPLIAFIDPLFIFGKARRCLHDYVAQTQVGYAPQTTESAPR